MSNLLENVKDLKFMNRKESEESEDNIFLMLISDVGIYL